MLEEEYTIESILLAKYILQGLDDAVGDISENRGLKDESWFVVRKAKMPSVLVEIGFVTHADEAKRLSDSQYLKKIARAIYNGMVSFIEYFDSTHAKGSTE
jgi:N-acetylmuramoyl-L-alanine amidase